MIELNGTTQLADIVTIARQRESVTISDATRGAIATASDRARALSDTIPVYGRTTGVGANRSTGVATDDSAHGLRLLRSHAVDAGQPLPDASVRAMLAVRLNQLCNVGAGLQPEILGALVTMLNEDALPTVLEYGSIGTGDLSALAGTALTLLGERPASRPLNALSGWGADSALPFISSSALTLGRACLVLDDLQRLHRASAVIYALSFVGLRGNPSPLSIAAASASASPHVEEIAARLRKLIMVPGNPARIQDPYGLRAFPIVTAPFADALARTEAQVEAVINVAQENPLFAGNDIIHHAGFYQAALALDLDTLALALAQCTPLALSRLRMMIEPDYTGQAPFLATGPAGASGVMILEYIAAAAHAEIRANSQPSSLGTAVLSRATEEDASFAPTAVTRIERAVAPYRILLACELFTALRLLRLRGVKPSDLSSDLLRSALALGFTLPADTEDRDLRLDLASCEHLVDHLGDLS